MQFYFPTCVVIPVLPDTMHILLYIDVTSEVKTCHSNAPWSVKSCSNQGNMANFLVSFDGTGSLCPFYLSWYTFMYNVTMTQKKTFTGIGPVILMGFGSFNNNVAVLWVFPNYKAISSFCVWHELPVCIIAHYKKKHATETITAIAPKP